MYELTKRARTALIKGLSRSMNGKYTKADYDAVLVWAESAIESDPAFLDMVLSGYMDPFFLPHDGLLRFKLNGYELAATAEPERLRK